MGLLSGHIASKGLRTAIQSGKLGAERVTAGG